MFDETTPKNVLRERGQGLALDDIGIVYGTVGVIAFVGGALLGGFVVSRHGLKFWLWPMLLAIHLPDAVFIWLAGAQPQSLFAIGAGGRVTGVADFCVYPAEAATRKKKR